MTPSIKKLIESQGLIICPSCNGEGEYETFCGHYTTETCSSCRGAGVVRSLRKQKQRRNCAICEGREGGCGGCDYKGYHEWETYELI